MLKIVYDLALLFSFRHIKAPEELRREDDERSRALVIRSLAFVIIRAD